MQGIWPPGVDFTEVNSVDRSQSKHVDGYELVASADDHGKVKVFRYPCTDDSAQPVIGKGHSSHVTNVRFAKGDKYLYSTGGNDTCVF